MSEEQMDQPKLSRQEAEEFVTRILQEKLPETYPADIKWINELIQAFQRKQPFQNITVLSQLPKRCVPSGEDIYRDILQEGKGGLCLSLNFAFAAVLRSFGVHAYSAAAEYVASGLAVHVVTIIDVNKPHKTSSNYFGNTGTEERKDFSTGSVHDKVGYFLRPRNSNCCKTMRLGAVKGQEEIHEKNCERETQFHETDSIYLADVGCGFPTLQAINLVHDLDKVRVECGLEYYITRKGKQYLRLHRAGDEVPEGEEAYVNHDGWRPVFSFTLTPQPLAFFQRTMRSVYISLADSPYFSELHAVRYLNSHSMLAVKNETFIKSLSPAVNSKLDCLSPNESNSAFLTEKFHKNEPKYDEGFARTKADENRVKLRKGELIKAVTEFFPMIPSHEVEKALTFYFST